MRLPPFYLWTEIPDDAWSALLGLAAQREERQAKVHTSRYWRENPHLPGLCGEWLYGNLTGQEMSWTPEVWTAGEDFPGVDVKTTTHARSPHLSGGNEQRVKAPLLFGTAVDLDKRLVKGLGFATRPMLAAAPWRKYGHGSAHRLEPRDLLSADELLAQFLRGRTLDAIATENGRRDAHTDH